ncbi:MAG: MetQ/NlpA family ABC transporter substrate-binding protein [Azospirillaceae bacterium]|nr:MetQ/NlpA family ABC transporter substrate-binding protein [Azospirillaceae bacterium]
MFSQRLIVQLAAGFVLGLIVSGTPAAPVRADVDIRLGLASPGPLADPVYQAVKEARDQGINVQVIEFTDWITPNVALADNDIDLNYYQHIPFLETASQAKGYHFISVGVGTSSKLGLYSKKHKSFAEIPDGGTIAIANDPVNGGRGLVLLEQAGLIRLKPGLDYKATVDDIVENPKHLKIVEVMAQQLPRTLDDVDLAEGYAHLLKDFGIDPQGALLFDTIQQRYALQWVARPDNPRLDQIRKFVQIYQTSPKVREILKEKFGDLIVPAW